MKIAIVGATGHAGSRLVDEALSRGHRVTAIARNATRLPPDGNLSVSNVDAANPGELAEALELNEVEHPQHVRARFTIGD
jgi:putative NADH-flavin reductase